jgi:hypothetical protein
VKEKENTPMDAETKPSAETQVENAILEKLNELGKQAGVAAVHCAPDKLWGVCRGHTVGAHMEALGRLVRQGQIVYHADGYALTETESRRQRGLSSQTPVSTTVQAREKINACKAFINRWLVDTNNRPVSLANLKRAAASTGRSYDGNGYTESIWDATLFEMERDGQLRKMGRDGCPGDDPPGDDPLVQLVLDGDNDKPAADNRAESRAEPRPRAELRPAPSPVSLYDEPKKAAEPTRKADTKDKDPGIDPACPIMSVTLRVELEGHEASRYVLANLNVPASELATKGQRELAAVRIAQAVRLAMQGKRPQHDDLFRQAVERVLADVYAPEEEEDGGHREITITPESLR